MHASLIVRRFMGSVGGVHRSRIGSYTDLVSAVADGGQLTLSSLARRLHGRSCKAKFKRVDRLIGSDRIVDESVRFGSRMLEICAPQSGVLLIGVDWSSASPGGTFAELRASLLCEGMGRGLTIYQETYTQKNYGTPRVELGFLQRLKALVPKGRQVILVTDAGFRRQWFMAAERLGFSWVGRVRQGQMLGVKGRFHAVNYWFAKAPLAPIKMDDAALTKGYQMPCDLVLWRKKLKRGKRYRRPGYGPTPKANKEAKVSATEPWLLATSTDLRYLSAEQIVGYYAARMQIEENFRDHKSVNFGFGQEKSRSRTKSRIQALLLIGTLAAFMMWHIGQLGEAENIQKFFKATTRVARELSLISLARAICQHPEWLLSPSATKSLAGRLGSTKP